MKKFLLTIPIILILLPLFTSTSSAYTGGLINGLTGTVSNGQTTTAITDNNEGTAYVIPGAQTVRYTLSTIEVAHSFKLRGSAYYGITVRLLDSANQYLYHQTFGLNGSTTYNLPSLVSNVKYVEITNNHASNNATIYELDVMPQPDTSPPTVPTSVVGTPLVESVNLTWAASTDDRGIVAGYNVYKNSTKVNTALITSTNYTVPAMADTNFQYQVAAVDPTGNMSSKSTIVTVSSMLPEQKPILTSSEIQTNSIHLSWEDVAPNYELYQDGSLIKNLINHTREVDVTLLEPNTEYTFSLIAIDKYTRRITSDPITITTQAGITQDPQLTFTDITHNSFNVSWNPTDYTTDYSVFMNGSLVSTQATTTYSFTGLNEKTIYQVKIVSNGIYSDGETSRSVTTLESPLPVVQSATVSRHPTDNTKRNLSYEATPLVTAVKVYVDGVLIGEYPTSQEIIELDFTNITDTFASVKVEPVDVGGKSYEFQALTKSVGITEVDNLIAKFAEGSLLHKNAFWYLALGAIPLMLAVAAYFFLRRKYKATFGESKKEAAALINQPSGEVQHIRDGKEEKRKFIPWKEMTQEQKNEFRQRKGGHIQHPLTDAEKFTFEDKSSKMRIVEKKYKEIRTGFMGTGGVKFKPDFTYERNGVQYKEQYVKGQGKVFVPKDFSNKIKLVSNQFNAVKTAFTVSNKKKF